MATNDLGETDLRKTDPSSVRFLPESQGDLICIAMKGIVSENDFKYFQKQFLDIVGRFGHYRLLVHYQTDFKGWAPEAADMNLKIIIEYGPKARRIAYVNPPERKIFQTQLQRPILGSDVKIFPEDDLEKAMTWIRSDP